MALVMSISNANIGGVRNLRAIFENKSGDLSTSPPSRGRSPNGSVSSTHSRPISRVRTSFVAVERSGEAGGPPQLRLTRALEEAMDNSSVFEEAAAGLGVILKGSPFEEPGQVKSKPVQPQPEKKSSAPVQKAAGSTGAISTKPANINSKTEPKSASTKPAAPAAIQTKPTSPVETKKTPTTSTMPTVPKPRGGGAKIQAVMESAREAREARAAVAQTDADETKKNSVPKAPTPTVAKAPRASLPARIGRTPGAATAPTASSVARTDGSKDIEPRSTERKAGTMAPPRVANVTTASSLAKKTSRASIGTSEPSKPRVAVTKPADEGFLARMMRPTASSAQKTHDKVQVDSPPRSKPTNGTKIAAKKPPRKSLNTENNPTENNGGDSSVDITPTSEEQPKSNGDLEIPQQQQQAE